MNEDEKEGQEKKCFVISPIGKRGSEQREWADTIFEHVITPALENRYTIERADRIAESGLISHQIIERLVTSELVIADLSYSNPNVYYELALRHAIKKPVVHLMQARQPIPFDVSMMRMISVSTHIREAKRSIEEISKQVRSLEQDPGCMTTPISLSIDLLKIEQDENPLAESFKLMAFGMFTISEKLSEIEYEIGKRKEHPWIESSRRRIEELQKRIMRGEMPNDQMDITVGLIRETKELMGDFLRTEGEKEELSEDLETLEKFFRLLEKYPAIKQSLNESKRKRDQG